MGGWRGYVGVTKYHYLILHRPTSELRSFVKVEVAILGSPSLIDLAVSVDVKEH